jgi:hypothetical protein
MASVQQLFDQQAQLLPEQSERLMRQVVDHNRQLVSEAHAMRAMNQDVPAELPPPLPSNLSLQAKKTEGKHQKAMARAQARAKKARVTTGGRKSKETVSKRQTRSQKTTALLQVQQM